MAQQYRHSLPQLGSKRFISDGGMETTLLFFYKMDLPGFASFPLVTSEEGHATLTRYFQPYLKTALDAGVGFVLETATWRANPDWIVKLGCSADDIFKINAQSVDFCVALRSTWATAETPIVISGVVGPRGDGYKVADRMEADQAREYHRTQVECFAASEVDMVTAYTITYPEEAEGIVLAAQAAKIPVAISFTLETDGCLPSGHTLQAAIEQVDKATGSGPVYYMVNCVHPEHFAPVLTANNAGAWLHRIRGVRANASTLSHAELDSAKELDSGDPGDLGRRYQELCARLPHLTVLGGCCGTDHRHIVAICDAVGGGKK